MVAVSHLELTGRRNGYLAAFLVKQKNHLISLKNLAKSVTMNRTVKSDYLGDSNVGIDNSYIEDFCDTCDFKIL